MARNFPCTTPFAIGDIWADLGQIRTDLDSGWSLYHPRLPDLSPSWSHWHCTFTNYRKLSTTFSLLYHWNCTSVPVGEWQPILFRYCSKLMMSQGCRTTSWIVSQQSKIELVDYHRSNHRTIQLPVSESNQTQSCYQCTTAVAHYLTQNSFMCWSSTFPNCIRRRSENVSKC